MNNMKNSDIFNSFSELGIGWLSKETNKKQEEDELLCVSCNNFINKNSKSH